MVLYTIKNLLPVKDISETILSSGLINTLKFCKDSVLEKQWWRKSENGIR